MNESPSAATSRRFLLLNVSEWLTTVVSIVALVLLIFSYDCVLIRGDPAARLPAGCYPSLALVPGTRWIIPLQPYFSIGLIVAGIAVPALIARRRNSP